VFCGRLDITSGLFSGHVDCVMKSHYFETKTPLFQELLEREKLSEYANAVLLFNCMLLILES